MPLYDDEDAEDAGDVICKDVAPAGKLSRDSPPPGAMIERFCETTRRSCDVPGSTYRGMPRLVHRIKVRHDDGTAAEYEVDEYDQQRGVFADLLMSPKASKWLLEQGSKHPLYGEEFKGVQKAKRGQQMRKRKKEGHDGVNSAQGVNKSLKPEISPQSLRPSSEETGALSLVQLSRPSQPSFEPMLEPPRELPLPPPEREPPSPPEPERPSEPPEPPSVPSDSPESLEPAVQTQPASVSAPEAEEEVELEDISMDVSDSEEEVEVCLTDGEADSPIIADQAPALMPAHRPANEGMDPCVASKPCVSPEDSQVHHAQAGTMPEGKAHRLPEGDDETTSSDEEDANFLASMRIANGHTGAVQPKLRMGASLHKPSEQSAGSPRSPTKPGLQRKLEPGLEPDGAAALADSTRLSLQIKQLEAALAAANSKLQTTADEANAAYHALYHSFSEENQALTSDNQRLVSENQRLAEENQSLLLLLASPNCPAQAVKQESDGVPCAKMESPLMKEERAAKEEVEPEDID